ncbi:MAG: hypothetical protein JSS02_27925 [Planctomycetes bacterium]|nr:hypothetical protein [Planctomycetota bacterium]
MNATWNACWLCLAGIALSGCASMNNTQTGALAGTGLGAVTGAIIGEATGSPGAGAAIGAAAGAVTGALVGNAEDQREQRDAAVAQAQYESARSHAIAQAVTESEVVRMVENRVSDDVIITSIRTRGCFWDATPDAVIRLKQLGVGDRVIQAMQNSGVRVPAGTRVVSGGVYYVPPPPPPVGVVVVRPRYYGPHYYGWGRPYHRRF